MSADLRRAAAAVWFVAMSGLWFVVARSELAHGAYSEAPAATVTTVALVAVGGRLLSLAVEAFFYTALWRAALVPVRFPWLVIALGTLSLLDALGLPLARWGLDTPHAPWLAWIVGIRVLPGVLGDAPGLRLSLESVGLLAALRIAGTAAAQARHGARFRDALLLTTAVWLAGRLVVWWVTDLVRGMSPLR